MVFYACLKIPPKNPKMPRPSEKVWPSKTVFYLCKGFSIPHHSDWSACCKQQIHSDRFLQMFGIIRINLLVVKRTIQYDNFCKWSEKKWTSLLKSGSSGRSFCQFDYPDEMACRKEDSPVLQLFLQMIWLHKIDSACTNSYRTVEISFWREGGGGGAARVTGIGREYVSPWEKIAALCISPDYRAPLRPDDEELANYPF